MDPLSTYCRDALAVIAILFLIVPAAFPQGPISHLPLKARQIHKRQHHDPWNLCPREMNSGDCFYVYLKVYAQLRQNGSQQGPDRIMVGKRSQAESMWSARSYRTGRPQVRDLSDFPGLLDSLVRGQV